MQNINNIKMSLSPFSVYGRYKYLVAHLVSVIPLFLDHDYVGVVK